MRARQLSTDRPGRAFLWTHHPACSVRAYVASPQGPWPCVSTRSHELTVVLDGEIVCELGPHAQTVRVRAGEAIVVPRGRPHVLRIETRSRLLVLDRARGPTSGDIRHVPAHAMPASPLRTLDRAWRQRGIDALPSVRDVARDLEQRTGARGTIAIEPARHGRRMETAKRMIEEQPEKPPSLEALARAARTSRFHLLRQYKRHYGFTPFDYAQFLRLERLLWSLVERGLDRTLLALSGEAGSSDYSTFHHRMRDIFRRAPSELLDDDALAPLGPIV
jgi:AraC-like DNA-binding protein/mannose-6-phosphate isomerase-like protein (cupin superfamily)